MRGGVTWGAIMLYTMCGRSKKPDAYEHTMMNAVACLLDLAATAQLNRAPAAVAALSSLLRSTFAVCSLRAHTVARLVGPCNIDLHVAVRDVNKTFKRAVYCRALLLLLG